MVLKSTYHKSFFMNIYKLSIMVVFKHFKCKVPQSFKFSHENSVKA